MQPECKGTGWKENRDDPWKSKPCPTCKGSGHATAAFSSDKEEPCTQTSANARAVSAGSAANLQESSKQPPTLGDSAASRFKIGDPVKIKDTAASAFAGQNAWVRYPDEEMMGYYLRVGPADHMWFGADEIEARDAA